MCFFIRYGSLESKHSSQENVVSFQKLLQLLILIIPFIYAKNQLLNLQTQAKLLRRAFYVFFFFRNLAKRLYISMFKMPPLSIDYLEGRGIYADNH